MWRMLLAVKGRSPTVARVATVAVAGAAESSRNGPRPFRISGKPHGKAHRASPELYDETDDAEYGRDAHTPGEQGRPGCSAPVVGMGAPRDVDPERGEQNDASRRSGYGRPKKPVHGLARSAAEAPLAGRGAGNQRQTA